MIRLNDDHRAARATLTYVAEPADPVLGHLLQVLSPAEVLASIRSGTSPARAVTAMDQAQPSREVTGAGHQLASWCPAPGSYLISSLSRLKRASALSRVAALSLGMRVACWRSSSAAGR